MPRRALVERALLVAFLGSLANDARAAHKEDPVGTLPPPPRTVQAVRPPALTLRRDVYFEATSPLAQLQVRYPDGWRTLCVHPGCLLSNAYVGATYRVTGPGLVGSRWFSIYPNPGTFYVHADVASSAGEIVGVALMGAGAVALVIGGVYAGTSAICIFCTEKEKDAALAPGAALVGGGLLLLTAGIVLFATTTTRLRFGRLAPLRGPVAFRRGLELFGKGVEF